MEHLKTLCAGNCLVDSFLERGANNQRYKIQKVREVYISSYRRKAPARQNVVEFGVRGEIADMIMQTKS